MAAKRESKSPYSEPRRAIRLYLPEAEYDRVRVAAAVCRLPMSEFCRQGSLEKVVQVEKKK